MIITHVLFVALVSLLGASQVYADSSPSSDAKGMSGAKGTFSFKPTDHTPGIVTWWKDTDGVSPGVAGCHVGTNEQGVPNGRMFGEACLDDGMLVESNPGKGVIHRHKSDIGHPDKFDCNAWCVGEGMTEGVCKVASAPPCEQSAVCACE
ncbi:hypothetical protein [Alkalimarinus alittae]|uniref:Uncharacterized protein n=1 Tax=Alkalimarinus alittae TaxID=2961619 RepID=A0ABY6MXW7_9ALTE|nr:hypothetical protein [Alkalimarinus alittae]UZE94624.1 hypothetical protein NKI27_11045 [Alkalimarinus alittae]